MHTNKVTKFFSTADPLSYMACLVEKLENEDVDYKISGNELKITFDTMLKAVPEEEDSDEEEKKNDDDAEEDEDSTPVKCVVRFFNCQDEKNNGKHCVDFSYFDKVKGKNVGRDERVPFNFREFINADKLKDYHDSQFE